MDVLLRLLTTIDNNDLKQRVLKWLTDIDLIKNLINLFSYNYANDAHSNVSQLLCDIIRISREQLLAYRENQRDAIMYNLTMNNQQSPQHMGEIAAAAFLSNNNNTDPSNIQIDCSMTNPLLDMIEA